MNKDKIKLTRKCKNQLSELWGKVGFIVHLSQMIEYNLANICAFDTILCEFESVNSMPLWKYDEFVCKANELYSMLQKSTLGKNIHELKQCKLLPKDIVAELQHILEERNYVVHQMFKDDLAEKRLETSPIYYFERLENLVTSMYKINEQLSYIIDEQKTKYNLIY